MAASSTEKYLTCAAKCRNLAQRCIIDSDRVRWLSMAQFWARLAEQQPEHDLAQNDPISRTVVLVSSNPSR
jgi:hypothetical protein